MVGANGALAIIPSDCFRWRPRVQFIESFRTREQAVDYAFQHEYNLIVERSEGSSTLFDVMLDPDGSCTDGLNLELLNTEEEVLVDPYAEGWTVLMLRTLWQLVRRSSTAAQSFCVAQVLPCLRRAASSTRPAIERAMRRVSRKITRPSSVGAHSPSWHSSVPASCRVRTFSLSTARVRARRIAARAAAFYHREAIPFCRSAAGRCWWSNPAVALRRWWRTHLHGSVSDAARRLAAEASVLYARQVTPRLRYALSRCRQADIQGVCRRGWTNTLSAASDLARRFATVVAAIYARQVTPRLHYALSRCRQADIQGACRRAWSVTILTAIRLADQFAAAVAALYVRQVAPRMRQAAARCQEADFEGTLRRSIEAVAPAQHSNSSQIG